MLAYQKPSKKKEYPPDQTVQTLTRPKQKNTTVSTRGHLSSSGSLADLIRPHIEVVPTFLTVVLLQEIGVQHLPESKINPMPHTNALQSH